VVKDLKVTLYEIFGYVLPGAILLLGILTIFWSIFLPDVSVPIHAVSSEVIIVFLTMTYFSGHVVQALGNIITRITGITDTSMADEVASELGVLFDLVKKDIADKIKLNVADLKVADVVRISDETNVQLGISGDREIYQYREGFYRGLSVACVFLTLAIIARIIAGTPKILHSNVTYEITTKMLFFSIGISGLGVLLFYNRYIRFMKYRIRHAIMSYLVISGVKTQLKP